MHLLASPLPESWQQHSRSQYRTPHVIAMDDSDSTSSAQYRTALRTRIGQYLGGISTSGTGFDTREITANPTADWPPQFVTVREKLKSPVGPYAMSVPGIA
eukprot:3941970-Rhodomonas_salina.7